MKKFVDAVKHPAAPFAVFALLLVVDTILHNAQAFTLCTIVGVLFCVVMVISTLCNLKAYGKVVRGLAIMLCAFTVMYYAIEAEQLRGKIFRPSVSAVSSTGNTSAGHTSASHASASHTSAGHTSASHTSAGHTSASYTSSASGSNSASRTCYSCNGTKKCHVCNGKGSSLCPGRSCQSGRCRDCRGTGVYNHGSYTSRCIVCSGDGRCNICNGTSRRACSICHGSGRCTNCR